MSTEFSSKNTSVPASEIAAGLGKNISLTPYIKEPGDSIPPSADELHIEEMLKAHLRGESLEDWPVLKKPWDDPPPLPPSGWSSVKGWLSKVLRL